MFCILHTSEKVATVLVFRSHKKHADECCMPILLALVSEKLSDEQVAAVISVDPVINCVPAGSLCTFLEVCNNIQV